MKIQPAFSIFLLTVLILPFLACAEDAAPKDGLSLSWAANKLKISGAKIPGGAVEILYLEAYCRPGSTDRAWKETTIGHKTTLLEASPDGKTLKLRCEVNDGIVVDHVITASADEVDFRLTAHNPTQTESNAQWVQPCVELEKFTALGKLTYLPKCFIYLDGKMERMPTRNWAEKARYIPGQVWCPKHVDRNDVNPRPLSDLVPSNGLIGCFSGDDKLIFATAWEPYQELFQGVRTCLHADFRIGGLKPGETKKIRGKVYIVETGPDALLRRYEKDFPEHKP